MDNTEDINDEDLLDYDIQMNIQESCQNSACSERYEVNLYYSL